MADTCRKCRWSRVDTGNPMKGVCFFGRRDGSAGESASGVSSTIIKGKLVNLSDKACENFEPKPSHAQQIREGI
ncbi:hypothetical protein [Desulfobacterium sp. N47]|uniref:Uncharacterized protein n=2 Tax=Bacteria TaxID=2 RepID=E1YFQ8_9BACT